MSRLVSLSGSLINSLVRCFMLHAPNLLCHCAPLAVSELSTEIGAFENATIFKHGLDRVRTQSFLPPSIRPSVNILPSHRPANEGENVEKLIFALSSNLRKSAYGDILLTVKNREKGFREKNCMDYQYKLSKSSTKKREHKDMEIWLRP